MANAKRKQTTTATASYVVRTPGLLGGEPHVEGHRIRVRDVVAARDLGGLTPEEIAANAFPELTLAQVYAALAYYEDHRAEVDASEEEEARFVEEFKRLHPDLVRDVMP